MFNVVFTWFVNNFPCDVHVSILEGIFIIVNPENKKRILLDLLKNETSKPYTTPTLDFSTKKTTILTCHNSSFTFMRWRTVQYCHQSVMVQNFIK